MSTTCTFLLHLFLCLVYSEMIALLMHSMRQPHPYLLGRVSCPPSTAGTSITEAAPSSHLRLPPCPTRLPTSTASGVYDTYSRSISSVGWSSGIPSAPPPTGQPIFPPATAAACPPETQRYVSHVAIRLCPEQHGQIICL